MTTQEITDVFSGAFASADELRAALVTMTKQAKLRTIELQIAALNDKSAELLKPISDERIQLEALRREAQADLAT